MKITNLGVRDLLRRQERPVFFEAARFLLLSVDLDSVSSIGVDDESVQVRKSVRFALGFLLPQEVGALVVEDEVDTLVGTANIGTSHDGVFSFTVEVLGIVSRREELDVASTAVNVLTVLDRELENKVLAFSVEDFLQGSAG